MAPRLVNIMSRSICIEAVQVINELRCNRLKEEYIEQVVPSKVLWQVVLKLMQGLGI